jgi:hypothetical protein
MVSLFVCVKLWSCICESSGVKTKGGKTSTTPAMRTKGTLSWSPKCRLLITSLHEGCIMVANLGCSHRIKGVKVYSTQNSVEHT